MKQVFAVAFFLVVGGGLGYWYVTEGKDLMSGDGELTIAMPRRYMPAIRAEPQTLDDIIEIMDGEEPDRVRESLDALVASGRLELDDRGRYRERR